MAYDVIVVGARVAGSATAMLLARNGLAVLVVDRASFPSDTLSTHQVQVPGAARLRRWGILDRLEDAGTPATRTVTFGTGAARFTGRVPTVDDGDAMYSPRRTLLDASLVDAARDAGAEVAESTIVEGLLFGADRVEGVRLHAKGGGTREVRAALVIGADGKSSSVAKAVAAPTVVEQPPSSLAFYTYWEGVELDGAQIRQLPRRVVGVFPTNDGQVISYIGWPASERAAFQRDHEDAVTTTLGEAGDLGERVLAGRRVAPVRGTTDLPNVIRRPYGPGWALAGDAGLVMDPITGQGIGHALRDAELLSTAVTRGLAGASTLDVELRGYAKARDRETKPMFDLTVGLARFADQSPAEAAMFEAIASSQHEADSFIAMMSGVIPPGRFFAPPHLIKLVGVRRFVQLARSRPRAA